MSPEVVGVATVLASVVAAIVVWKLLKLAFKLALFAAVVVALAAGVGGYLKYGRVSLPVPSVGASPLQ